MRDDLYTALSTQPILKTEILIHRGRIQCIIYSEGSLGKNIKRAGLEINTKLFQKIEIRQNGIICDLEQELPSTNEWKCFLSNDKNKYK